jgi:hypothetical protein
MNGETDIPPAQYTSFMQALFRGTYWLRFWLQLQRDVPEGELNARGYCLGTGQSRMET